MADVPDSGNAPPATARAPFTLASWQPSWRSACRCRGPSCLRRAVSVRAMRASERGTRKDTSETHTTVLSLLALLGGGLGLLEQPGSHQSVLGLEPSHRGDVVVDQTEPGGLAATEDGVETEDDDARLVRDLVHLREQVLDFCSRDRSNALVQDLDDLWTERRVSECPLSQRVRDAKRRKMKRASARHSRENSTKNHNSCTAIGVFGQATRKTADKQHMFQKRGKKWRGDACKSEEECHTNCFLWRRGLVMNWRVLMVAGMINDAVSLFR